MAASLAYYFLLSLFPLLIFVITLIPYLSISEDMISGLINDYAPGQTGQLFDENIQNYLSHPSEGLMSIGIIVTLWSASNGVGALIRVLNRAYSTEETRSFVKLKFISIGLTIAMVFVIAVTLLLPVFGHLIIEGAQHFLYIPEGLAFPYRIHINYWWGN